MTAIPGPVAPSATALATLSPLGLDAVRLDPEGHLGGWQRLNAAATLPHCIDNLESSGVLGNLRHLAGESDEPFTGMWFADSDLYKTLEGAAWQLARDAGDPALRAFVDGATKLLAAGQAEDGYLNSWIQLGHPDERWSDLKWGHELYCAGHLVQAAVAAARTGASAELVRLGTRFADLISETFGPAGRDGICGHPEIETALVELYRVSGERRYLECARQMIERRGHGLLASSRRGGSLHDPGFGAQYFQDHQPVRTATEATGHAVRQLYLESGVVDVAVESQDADLLAASERIWDDLFGTKTYVTGAHGSRHRDEAIGDAYELPSDRAYAETCAAIASFHWNWRLLLATGRHRYADELERVLYNAVAVSTARDGAHYFYSNPLQLRPGHDGSDEDAPSQRLSWYRCACCPPNLARLLASLNGYLATTDAAGVQLHLYGAATIRAQAPGGGVTLDIRTDYPWSGRVEITVAAGESDEPWTLSLRVPGWCAGVQASIDGAALEPDVRDGYLRITRTWAAGTAIVLDLDMPARFIAGHPRVDAIRGCVALARGPLVYCLEQADLADGVALDEVRLDAGAAPSAVARDDVLDVPIVLTARGTVAASRPDLYREPAGDAERGAPLAVTAIPYFRWANRTPGAMRVWVPVVEAPA